VRTSVEDALQARAGVAAFAGFPEPRGAADLRHGDVPPPEAAHCSSPTPVMTALLSPCRAVPQAMLVGEPPMHFKKLRIRVPFGSFGPARPAFGATLPHSLRGFVRRQIRARLPAPAR